MSALKQFRQPGGFQQLLQVLEISEPTKQRGMLQLVALEDPGWAHLLKLKILTVDRILQWESSFLQQILVSLPTEPLFHLYSGSSEKQRAQIDRCLPAQIGQELRTMLTNKKPATSQAVFMAGVRLIQSVRELQSMGAIDLNIADPSAVYELSLVA
jgi:flagellar motor switch protein FliG